MSDKKLRAPPPKDRYSPLIRPDHEAWKITEDRFRRILANPAIRIHQVLDEYFTPHERKLFLPATQPRSLRECQEDNARRYHALFQGRFKGHCPSLATKFTMLYFGLPVEPVLSHLVDQGKPIFDVDDWEELQEAEVCPPMHFLTAHDRRNFGHDHMRGTEAHYSTIPIPASQLSEPFSSDLQGSDSQNMSLRGGGPDDDDDVDQDMPDMGNQFRQPLLSGPGLASNTFRGYGTGSSSKMPTSSGQTGLFGASLANQMSESPPGRSSGAFDNPQSNLSSTTRPTDVPSGPFNKAAPRPTASTIDYHAGTMAAGSSAIPSSSVGGFAPPPPPPPGGSSMPSSGYFPPSSFGPRNAVGYGTTPSSAETFQQLFGFQGRVSFNPSDLSTLEKAARSLLSLKEKEHSDMVLAHISRSSSAVERSLETTTHTISNGELAQYVNEQKSNPDCVWFIHRRGETAPTSWGPTESDFLTCLVKLRHFDNQGQENLAYLKMPPRKTFFHDDVAGYRFPPRKPWGINQYMPFLVTAQEVLVGRPNKPGENNCDLTISSEPGTSTDFARQLFGGLEIDHEFWSMMHPRCNNRRPFTVTSHPLENEHSAVFYLPGRLARSKEFFRQEGSDDLYPEARRTLEMFVKHANITAKPAHYRIWRGTDFFSGTIYPADDRRPVRWNHLDASAEQEDQKNLSKFIQDAIDDAREPCRFFVVQPVDGDEVCRLRASDVRSGYEDFGVDTHKVDAFKSKVRRLYESQPGKTYEPEKDYVLIEPAGVPHAWNQSQFILRPEAPDNELAMIRRLIIAAEVHVTVLKDDGADYVKQLDQTPWGPRYGEVTRFRRELGHPILPQPSEHFARPSDPQAIPSTPREAPQEPREITWSQQPSVFDKGVYNPSIPINAPPLEQIMRPGGTRVPMVTKAVLTSTEQRQLQKDFWTLRGIVLDRVSKCPYAKCRFAYRLDQDDEFMKHLEKSHVGDKCPWCSEQLFAHWSMEQREDHFQAKHSDVFRQILDMPKPASAPRDRRPVPGQQATTERAQDLLPASTIMERVRPPVGPLPRSDPPTKANGKEIDYRFCDRCGRDHQTLNDKNERDHHDRRCLPLAEGAGRCTFCETCGDNVWNSKRDRDELAPYDDFPHSCRGTSHAKKPYCVKCGFSLRQLPDDAIDRHRQHCGGFYADLGCFCPYCQKGFVQNGVQENVEEIKQHIVGCSAKQPPNITPYDIYPESYWKNRDEPADSLYLGEEATNALVSDPRPRGPSRYLAYPLAWHDKPGPRLVQDPPSECTAPGCREPFFGLTPSEVLAHFETKHYGIPLSLCPLCHLSFKNPQGEIENRQLQVAHMECHVFQLWDILSEKRAPPTVVQQEPFGPGHTLWDPENESALDRRDKRCPYFEKCGAMVGFMSQRQWNRHMESAHASEDFVGVFRPNIDDVLRAADEERREQRIREGKHPIPGTIRKPPGRLTPRVPGTGSTPGPRPGKVSTNIPPPIRPEESRPHQEGSGKNSAQESGGPQPGNLQPHMSPETRDPDESEHDSDTSRQPGDNVEGGSTQPPKPQREPTVPVAAPANTTKPSTKPAGPRPVPTSSTTKPPKTKPKPAGPVPVPTTTTTAKPSGTKTKPASTKPASVPSTSTVQPEFVPDDDMYCSRCFRKAPKKSAKASRKGDPDRQTQVNAHSDPKRSCRIHPGEGKVEYDSGGTPQLPSRVGWIKKSRNISFAQLKSAFLKQNPHLGVTMCPTDQSKRTLTYWVHDPNNDGNSDNWGLPFPGDSDDEEEDEDDSDGNDDNGDGNGDNGDEDYVDNQDNSDDEDVEDEGGDGEEEEEDGGKEQENENGESEWEEYDEEGEDGVTRRRRRRVYRGPGLPRDDTYHDNGEEDDLSEADPKELVPESDDEGSTTGGKRKRDASDAAERGNNKRPKVAEEQNQGQDEDASE